MSNEGFSESGLGGPDSGRPLDGKVVVLANGAEWAVLEYEGAGRYLVKPAGDDMMVVGSVSDLLAMGLAAPGAARYRVYYPAGETADVAIPETVAIRLGGHQAVFRDRDAGARQGARIAERPRPAGPAARRRSPAR